MIVISGVAHAGTEGSKIIAFKVGDTRILFIGVATPDEQMTIQ